MIAEEKITDLIALARRGESDYQIIKEFLSFVKEQAGVKDTAILRPEHVMDLCTKERNATKEHSIVLFLNPKNEVIKKIVSVGTVNTALVHPREVFRPAIVANATSIIFAHNHPSGNCEPSAEDRQTTRRLKEAGRIIGINVIDSIVITKDNYYSFKQEGLL